MRMYVVKIQALSKVPEYANGVYEGTYDVAAVDPNAAIAQAFLLLQYKNQHVRLGIYKADLLFLNYPKEA